MDYFLKKVNGSLRKKNRKYRTVSARKRIDSTILFRCEILIRRNISSKYRTKDSEFFLV